MYQYALCWRTMGLFTLNFLDLVNLESLQLCWEWLELDLPGVATYMKGSGSGLYPAKRGSDRITSRVLVALNMGSKVSELWAFLRGNELATFPTTFSCTFLFLIFFAYESPAARRNPFAIHRLLAFRVEPHPLRHENSWYNYLLMTRTAISSHLCISHLDFLTLP